jgi:type II secretory pathway pseudopilin PulG
MPRKLALWVVLLIVGFLTGFILQYARLQQAQQELSASRKQLGSCQASEQLSQVRDTATVMFLVSGGRAKELRKGRGVLERVLRRSSANSEQHGGSRASQLAS